MKMKVLLSFILVNCYYFNPIHCLEDIDNYPHSLPYALRGNIVSGDKNNDQPLEPVTSICQAEGGSHHRCKPTAVEFFPSMVNRDENKIMMLSFGDSDDVSKLGLCSPESETTSMQPTAITNTINLMSHVFCRQMGYMTYSSRRATNVRDDRDRALWPTAVCNGTEQRLEDCYWPEATVSSCKHVVEVNCGDCSKYYSHVDDGIITSPGFPVSFPFTVQCDWLIHTQLGTGLELRFLFFNLPTSQLPQSQIGRSPCIASNAFIEIHPSPVVSTSNSPEESQQSSLEVDTLANSQRYCVTRNPERRIVIKSKAVWIHFSSGIHSSFLSSYTRRPSLTRRPIGIKIHFKALPADGMISSESLDDMPLHSYVLLGGIASVGFVLLFVISCYVCLKIRQRKLGGQFSGKTGVGGNRSIVCSTNSSSPGRSSVTSLGTTPKKWRRNFCSLETSRGTTGITTRGFGMNNKSFIRTGITMQDASQHNYEEIPAALQRPLVPPRVTDPLVMTHNNVSRQVAVRSESGPVSSQERIQRTASGGVDSKVTNSNYSSGRHLMSSSFRSPPTYVSRHYMQIVCDAEGNCQYIPREEIEDSEVFTRPLPPLVAVSNVGHASSTISRATTRAESLTSNRTRNNQPSLSPVEEDSGCSSTHEDSTGILPPYSQAVKLSKSPDRAPLKGTVSKTKSSSSVSTV